MAMFIRAELAEPGSQYIDSSAFNGFTSVHATLMIFLFIVPVFAGPRQLRDPDHARRDRHGVPAHERPLVLDACRSAGSSSSRASLLPGGAFSAGWTNYPPLATQQPDSNLLFQMGVQWAGASSIATALNFIVTIVTMRAPGMTFWRMPLARAGPTSPPRFWSCSPRPFIAGSQFLLMFDRVLHTNFFEVAGGGYVDRLPAHLLVLLPPGCLHHALTRVRDHLRGLIGLCAQADLRLPANGAVARGDPVPRVLRLGASSCSSPAWRRGYAYR